MLNNTDEILNKFAKEVIRNAKRNLRKKNASRDLSSSLGYDLNVHKNSFSLEFYMLPYGEFVDQGVRGKKSSRKAPKSPFKFRNKMPPSKPFEKWIRQRRLRGRDKKGRFITNKSLSFLIRRSIRDTGMKPSLFFTRPFDNAFKKLPNDLVEKFGLDIDDFIEHSINA